LGDLIVLPDIIKKVTLLLKERGIYLILDQVDAYSGLPVLDAFVVNPK
jgi:hypothetical protein